MGDRGDGEIAIAQDQQSAAFEPLRWRTDPHQQSQAWMQMLLGDRIDSGRRRSGLPPPGADDAKRVKSTT